MATDDEFLQVTLPPLTWSTTWPAGSPRGQADAEDLVQDTYLRAWRAWTAGNRPRRVAPWLATICLNLGRDRLRRVSLRSEVAVESLRSRRPMWTWRRGGGATHPPGPPSG
jgi:DNA-directed RNA polymerase specialized sigma24 family protein